MKNFKILLACIALFACGEESASELTHSSGECSKMLPDAKWGVYPSKIVSGSCGYLPSFWIYTDSAGKLDMTGDDCEMSGHFIHEEECREYSSFECSHPERDINANMHYTLTRTEGIENSVQYNGTVLVSIVDYDMQVSCEAVYEIRVIHHPNGVIEK